MVIKKKQQNQEETIETTEPIKTSNQKKPELKCIKVFTANTEKIYGNKVNIVQIETEEEFETGIFIPDDSLLCNYNLLISPKIFINKEDKELIIKNLSLKAAILNVKHYLGVIVLF